MFRPTSPRKLHAEDIAIERGRGCRILGVQTDVMDTRILAAAFHHRVPAVLSRNFQFGFRAQFSIIHYCFIHLIYSFHVCLRSLNPSASVVPGRSEATVAIPHLGARLHMESKIALHLSQTTNYQDECSDRADA